MPVEQRILIRIESIIAKLFRKASPKIESALSKLDTKL